MKFLTVSFMLLLFFQSRHVIAQQQAYFPDPDPGIAQKLEDWKDLKFGLLMHWGPYSQWGVVESWSICPEDLSWAQGGQKPGVAANYNEYVKAYEGLKNTFNPTKFNPEKWAIAAKDAGMKYMVFTTKHHDGFCMFDSRFTDYKITDKDCPYASQPKADVTREIFNTFRQNDFWIGAYFSKPDWHSNYYWWDRFPASDRNCNYSIEKHPDQWKKFVDYTYNQIDELVSNYGKVDILWLDGGWVRKTNDAEIFQNLTDTTEGSRWARNPQSQDINMPLLAKQIRAKQSEILIVDRAVPGPQQNYLTPEQHIPKDGLPYPWETCMSMGDSWSFVPNDRYKSVEVLIKNLVDIVSKGGNYLLNVGPSPDGELDPEAYNRLAGIGKWIKINGEAIYGSRRFTSYNDGENIRYTQSKDGTTIYIFLLKYPEAPLQLSNIHLPKNSKLKMLGSSKIIPWKLDGDKLAFRLPKEAQKSSEHVWVIKAEIPKNGV